MNNMNKDTTIKASSTINVTIQDKNFILNQQDAYTLYYALGQALGVYHGNYPQFGYPYRGGIQPVNGNPLNVPNSPTSVQQVGYLTCANTTGFTNNDKVVSWTVTNDK